VGQALVALGARDWDKLLTLVRVTMRPGTGHRFHYHPTREEIIYIVDGVAEQWVGREKRRLKAGECAFIPPKVVHAIFNSSKKPMTFLAILSPAKARGRSVDCCDEEPWRSLRSGNSLVPGSRPPSSGRWRGE
jgi:quercetin dioxygenase-like cupin family protein